jgi:hypothetical protein
LVLCAHSFNERNAYVESWSWFRKIFFSLRARRFGTSCSPEIRRLTTWSPEGRRPSSVCDGRWTSPLHGVRQVPFVDTVTLRWKAVKARLSQRTPESSVCGPGVSASFDAAFVGVPVPVPTLAEVETVLLPYTHFSVLMRLDNAWRR